MKISILGAGRVGGNLARALASKGHEVVLGHLDPVAAAEHWQGPVVQHSTLAGATASSTVVIHATPGNSALEMLSSLREQLDGKVLLDVSNATERLPSGMPGGLCYPNSSLAEKLQAALPTTRVVKSLNTMLFSAMTAPSSLQAPPTAYLSGNDSDAKSTVLALLNDLGWSNEWVLDLGGIESARATEALVLMVPHIIGTKGFRPFAVSVVF